MKSFQKLCICVCWAIPLSLLSGACSRHHGNRKELSDTPILIEAETDNNTLSGGSGTSETITPLAFEPHGEYALYWDLGVAEDCPDEDILNKEVSMLKRYVKGAVTDSAYIIGSYNRLIQAGRFCKISAGVDTVRIDCTKRLLKIIDTRFLGILPGCSKTSFSRHYTLNDSAANTDFQINIALRPETPTAILDFISTMLRDDINVYFDHGRIRKFKISSNSVKSAIKSYYKEFIREYRKHYALDKEDRECGIIECGRPMTYQKFIYPVWESPDKSLITYRFYEYGYNNGAHGWECDEYITFDNISGRQTSWKDFYTKEEFAKAIRILENRLYNYKTNGDGTDRKGRLNAAFGENGEISPEDTTTRRYDDPKKFPTPAMTKEGVVFSYPTYEKGANYDGVMHFVIPYGNKKKR